MSVLEIKQPNIGGSFASTSSTTSKATLAPPPKDLRIYILDSPRTRSQLFGNKMFSSHPQLTQLIHYYAAPSSYGPERIGLKFKHCAAAEETQQKWCRDYPGRSGYTYAQMNDIVRGQVKRIQEEEGKVPWLKDHCVSIVRHDLMVKSVRDPEVYEEAVKRAIEQDRNPTVWEKDFLDSVTPVILIRSPALTLPSWWKVAGEPAGLRHFQVDDEDFYVEASQKWAKVIFDYFRSQGLTTKSGIELPIVIDAEDLVHDPRAVVGKLCETLGIDPSGVEYEWPDGLAKIVPEGDDIASTFLGNLIKSTGIVQMEKRAEAIDLDAEEAKWRHQFGKDKGGNDVAQYLRRYVESDLPSYEHLRSHRLGI